MTRRIFQQYKGKIQTRVMNSSLIAVFLCFCLISMTQIFLSLIMRALINYDEASPCL